MNHPSPLEAIFFAALEKGAAPQRAAYLDEACAGDPDLRQRVERMLAAQAQAGSFLEQPALSPVLTADEQPVSERPGAVVGPYKLMEQIGEGGMGLVFVAEQQHPVRRKVALKVIKPGMDTRQVIARFEAERQALALMDHPHIARVLDGGETAGGRPYFVMELVKGVPITAYCDENQMPVRARLELFVHVCQAVQHAHQKGIIHRDLKPSNVLVLSQDGTPVVKVIDFGVAKALGQQLTDKTIYTQFAQLIGTPLYMAPEQAGESGLDVDTRSDIYALGVLLYELLTGTTPFDKERLKQANYDEMRRIIREEEPPKPSTRISTVGQLATTISAQRSSDPRRLSQLCRGELDWIVMKALEKDRGRRYETANGFAADVQRYLAGEPVLAAPASQWYRLRKFVRRHRGPVAAAGLVLLTLVGGIVGTAWGLVRAEHQRQLAEAKEREAVDERDAKAAALAAEQKALQQARLNAEQAQRNARHARQERDAKAAALAAEQKARRGETKARRGETKARRQAFAALRSMTADVVERKFPQGAVLTEDERAFLRGIIAQFDAFAAIKGDDADSRAVRAEGRFRVGNMRSRLGELKEAEKDYGQVLGILKQLVADFPSRPDLRQNLARSHFNRANLLIATGRLPEAERDYDEALSIQKQLAANSPSGPELRQELASSHNNRGNLLMATGRLKQAEKDYDQVVSIRKRLAADFPSRPEFRQELAISYNNLANLLRATGRLKEAEKDYDHALSIKKQLAADFPTRPEFRRDLATSHNNRGNLLRDTGRLRQAEKDYDQALSIYKHLAADFPFRPEFRRELALSHNNRGNLLRDTGRPKQAEEDYGQALSIQKRLAADFPSRPEFRQELARSHNNRGILLRAMGRLPEAEKDYGQALRILKQLAADFPSRPEFRVELARSHNNRGNLLRATVEVLLRLLEPARVTQQQKALAVRRLKEAEQDYDQALSLYKELAADFPNRPEFRRELASSHNNRGILLNNTGRLKEAEKDYGQSLSIYRQLAAEFPNQPDLRNELAGTCKNLAILYQRQGNWAAARPLLLEGRPHHLAALKANPRHPSYRQIYRNHLGVLTTVHAGLLEQEDAVRTAETCRDLGWDAPADAYDAACFLSQCILIFMVKHDKLDDKQRKEAAQFYGDAAMKLLREAVGKGYKDVPLMKKDTDLDPLRQREDFKKLVAELEKKGK
jgi:serine/threonine protein kinase